MKLENGRPYAHTLQAVKVAGSLRNYPDGSQIIKASGVYWLVHRDESLSEDLKNGEVVCVKRGKSWK